MGFRFGLESKDRLWPMAPMLRIIFPTVCLKIRFRISSLPNYFFTHYLFHHHIFMSLFLLLFIPCVESKRKTTTGALCSAAFVSSSSALALLACGLYLVRTYRQRAKKKRKRRNHLRARHPKKQGKGRSWKRIKNRHIQLSK